jgi:hypothetical protein
MLKLFTTSIMFVLGLFLNTLGANTAVTAASDTQFSANNTIVQADLATTIHLPLGDVNRLIYAIEATEEGEEDELHIVELHDIINGFFAGRFSLNSSMCYASEKIASCYTHRKHYSFAGNRCIALQVFRI